MKYGRVTRILHTLIAVGILLELLSSLVMRTPRPGRVLTPLQAFGYDAHAWVGMAVSADVDLSLHPRRRGDGAPWTGTAFDPVRLQLVEIKGAGRKLR